MGGIEPHAIHPTLRIGLEDRCQAHGLDRSLLCIHYQSEKFQPIWNFPTVFSEISEHVKKTINILIADRRRKCQVADCACWHVFSKVSWFWD